MITFEPKAGHSIYTAAQEATKLAARHGQEVEFQFNGTSLRTTPTSNPDDIVLIFSLKRRLTNYPEKFTP